MGNVLEWTRSIYREFPYEPSISEDQTKIRFGTVMVVRGGYFEDTGDEVYNRRYPFVYEGRGYFLGFRCVYELPTTTDGIQSLLDRGRI